MLRVTTPRGSRGRIAWVLFTPYRYRMATTSRRSSSESKPSLRSSLLAGRMLEDAIADLRFALRGLRRNPTFTVVSAVTIAVGIGATSAMLSIANGVLLREPPILEPDRMVAIWEDRGGRVRTGPEGRLLPYARYEAYREATQDVFQDLAGHAYAEVAVGTDGGAIGVHGFITSGNYFAILGLTPGAGRLYEADDEDSAVLSDRLWRSRFGADPAVVGRAISIDSRTFTIAGIAPPGFTGTMSGFTGDVWLPWAAYARPTADGEPTAYVVPIGRLRPGVDRSVAEERVAAAARSIPPLSAATIVRGARLEGLLIRSDLRETVAMGMAIMLSAAALLLLIACVNIAGMLLARLQDRRREVAVRLAIGAGGGRLVRQMLAESVLLALIGGAGGVLLAAAGTAALSSISFPFDVTITLDLTPDRTVLLATFTLTILTGVLFGLAPALDSARSDLTTSLKEGAQGPRPGRARGAFVVGQLAVSTLLLVTAGVFVRSLAAMTDVPLGFDPQGVLVATVSVGSHGYGEGEGRLFYDRLVERVRAVPGVEAAGLGSFVLLRGANAANDGRAADGGEDAPELTVWYNVVDPEYFAANRIELLDGRYFTEADTDGAPRVAVVNQTLAERLWPGQSAVGRALRTGGVEHEVVGVVRDGVYTFVNETRRAFSFYPFAQEYRAAMSLHVRSSGPLGPMAGDVRDIVRELDPNIAVGGLITMDEVASSSAFGPRFIAWLTTLFASVGLLLAALGVYGLLAMQVARRSREFGVRMALGAKARDVLLLVVGRGVRATVLGCALGVALALGTGRLLASLLYEVSPFDVVTLAVVPAVLLATATLAGLVPARRAARVSPTAMLREE